MMGTCAVGILRAPKRISVRRAASFPTDSGDSSVASERDCENHPSRCIAPSSDAAIGVALTEHDEPRDVPEKPSELAKAPLPLEQSKLAPSEFVRRLSQSSAARSARRAISIRSAGA